MIGTWNWITLILCSNEIFATSWLLYNDPLNRWWGTTRLLPCSAGGRRCAFRLSQKQERLVVPVWILRREPLQVRHPDCGWRRKNNWPHSCDVQLVIHASPGEITTAASSLIPWIAHLEGSELRYLDSSLPSAHRAGVLLCSHQGINIPSS